MIGGASQGCDEWFLRPDGIQASSSRFEKRRVFPILWYGFAFLSTIENGVATVAEDAAYTLSR